jgi:hypothetical protein
LELRNEQIVRDEEVNEGPNQILRILMMESNILMDVLIV